MERSEWPDDDAHARGEYPPAPLPPHERTWRHPSEVSGVTWTYAEPPLAIGRGLLITTGAIGGLLALAVLWAMLPSAGSGGQSSPTVVTSTANDIFGPAPTLRDTLVASSLDTRVTSTSVRPVAATTTTPSTAATTTPTTDVSTTNTTVAETAATVGTDQVAQVDSAPVAVGIGDSLVVTTARAVPAGSTTITLTGNDGQPHTATVVMVDRDLGLAVLSSDAGATASFALGPAATAGDVVTVLGSLRTSVSVSRDSAGHLTLDGWAGSTAEGTPVVNASGQLVGMCSHGTSGPELVSVANVGAMLKTPKASTSPWLGVHAVDVDQGASVDWVATNGPAAAAGIVAGDVIVAVDDKPVVGVDALKSAIATHAPGDAIVVSVVRPDETTAKITVTLAAPST